MPMSEDPVKRARQLANLKPENGKLGGRPKGALSWSTIVKDVLGDESLWDELEKGMANKPSWYATQNPRSLAKAIVVAQALKAMNGSHFSAEWLRKTGFGDQIDLTSNGESIKMEPVIVSVIHSRHNAIEGEVVTPRQIEAETDDATTSD